MTSHLRNELMEGRALLPRVGSVVQLETQHPPYVLLGPDGKPVEPVTPYLRDLALNDNSPLTGRSYANDLLRWFRFLWLLDVSWNKATEGEVAVMVGWLRTAPNPQRRRTRPGSPEPGSVNPRTGKRYLRAGYAPTTLNHALTVVSSFYDFHRDLGNGPLMNPVPVSEARRRALAHHRPKETKPVFRRARLRQRVPATEPRAIPDAMWDEFFAVMNHDRDRAAVLLYVSSGARASELLGVTPADIDWPGQTVYVVSKGTRLREPIPASPQALVVLAAYLDAMGMPAAHEAVFRTRRGPDKPLTYWAMRRVIQRANDKLKTNWSLHDLRHTAAKRMANDPNLTLAEVRAVLRHADLATTGRYLHARVEDLFDALQAHYQRPRIQRSIAPGYDPEDFKTVFGG
ncbi:tyrosine-type recombinase/integrase [Streptomyces rhizosphaerihabitans]|uniref:tyrosine-type recombinase/integrase n=1 Tax=Streptomyces rhizosphaerihabitans TaxID=1266770 RepID=UPI0021C23A77|nr:site-specific integrase [Streptomyces rhizosphaerihabitans]MCT9006066.1 tyrosine-type recombinase/integrase [Streptomyces rhizosphaerihabitans]